MKIISGIVAFTLTFGISVALIGLVFGFPEVDTKDYVSTYRTKSAYASKIERFLRKDVRNGNIRDRAIDKHYTEGNSSSSLYFNSDYQDAVNIYYRKSNAMNDSYLPSDFKYAWREHMEAWEKQAKYMNQINESDSVDGVIEKYSDNTKEINDTWYQVLRIAHRYGVDIDRSYYQ